MRLACITLNYRLYFCCWERQTAPVPPYQRRRLIRRRKEKAVRTSILNGLGPALRWLRDRRGMKQYQVAGAAGITKGMLSAYETGRQRPSLETLDKILNTLECDLNHLHNALQIVNGRPESLIQPVARPAVWQTPTAANAEPGVGRGATMIYQALGLEDRLPVEEERALSDMLEGFHRLLRYMHDSLQGPRSRDEQPEG
jgi:transcriptional regulator with XRE-family HTH domain